MLSEKYITSKNWSYHGLNDRSGAAKGAWWHTTLIFWCGCHRDQNGSAAYGRTDDLWLRRELTGDLKKDKIPGLGERTIKLLHAQGIHNTFQLLGDFFMQLNGPVNSLSELKRLGSAYLARLQDLQSPLSYRQTLVAALLLKVSHGFRIPGEQQEMVSSTKMTQDKWARFRRQVKFVEGKRRFWLTGQLQSDFEFIGAKTAENLMRGGMRNSFQLLGKYLQGLGAPDHAEAFKTFLGRQGPGVQTSALVAQVQEIVKTGFVVLQLAPDPFLEGQRLDFSEVMEEDKEPQDICTFDGVKKRRSEPGVSPSRRKEASLEGKKRNSITIMCVIVMLMLLAYVFVRRTPAYAFHATCLYREHSKAPALCVKACALLNPDPNSPPIVIGGPLREYMYFYGPTFLLPYSFSSVVSSAL
eukprot:g78902.t1